MLHVCDEVEKFGQSAPPYCGAGLEQLRDLVWIPPPQVTVQVPQLAQDAQLPSTKEFNSFHNVNINIHKLCIY